MTKCTSYTAIATIVAIVGIYATFAQAADNQLVVQISLERRQVLLGDPIMVAARLTNTSRNRVYILEDQYPSGLQLVVRRPDGQEVGYKGEWIESVCTLRPLEPGETITRTFDLMSIFDINAPGKYMVMAYHGTSSRDRNAVFSDPLEVTVTEGAIVFSERIVWHKKEPRPMGFRPAPGAELIYEFEATVTHEVKVLQGETGLRGVYHVALQAHPEHPAQEHWVLLGKVQPKSGPVLMLDEYGWAHILLRTSEEEYGYWAYRLDGTPDAKLKFTRDRSGILLPPQLCKDTRGKVFLRRPTPGVE